MAVSKSYSVEFDDSLLDMASWKNPRYEGSKLTGTRINYYTEGDRKYPYGLKPIIENKTCAIFIGNSIEQGEVTSSLDPLVDITNHSYVTIDTVLLVDLETLKSTKITHEQFNETENKKESFRRFIHENFPEGSKIVTKIINNIDSDLLKESHVWERKFGEPLPTLDSVRMKKEIAEVEEAKLNENKAIVGFSKEMGALYISKKNQFNNKSYELKSADIEQILKMYKKHKGDLD